MPLYWAFKIGDYKSEDGLRKGSSEIIIPLVQGRAFRGEKEEEVIIMQQKGKWEFTHIGEIANAKLLNPEEAFEKSLYRYEISISKLKPLRETYSIDDFAYSLVRVYKHYEKPYRHFTRKYARLREEDFHTIADGKIFLSRTAFGKLLNSLHPEHISFFLQHFLQDNPSLPFRNVDYVEALEQLNEYIEQNILSHVEMLFDIADSLEQLAPDQIEKVGFMGEDGMTDLIHKQISEIKSLQNKNQKNIVKGFSKELIGGVEKNLEYEKGFSKFFREYPIPLTYIKNK